MYDQLAICLFFFFCNIKMFKLCIAINICLKYAFPVITNTDHLTECLVLTRQPICFFLLKKNALEFAFPFATLFPPKRYFISRDCYVTFSTLFELLTLFYSFQHQQQSHETIKSWLKWHFYSKSYTLSHFYNVVSGHRCRCHRAVIFVHILPTV